VNGVFPQGKQTKCLSIKVLSFNRRVASGLQEIL